MTRTTRRTTPPLALSIQSWSEQASADLMSALPASHTQPARPAERQAASPATPQAPHAAPCGEWHLLITLQYELPFKMETLRRADGGIDVRAPLPKLDWTCDGIAALMASMFSQVFRREPEHYRHDPRLVEQHSKGFARAVIETRVPPDEMACERHRQCASIYLAVLQGSALPTRADAALLTDKEAEAAQQLALADLGQVGGKNLPTALTVMIGEESIPAVKLTRRLAPKPKPQDRREKLTLRGAFNGLWLDKRRAYFKDADANKTLELSFDPEKLFDPVHKAVGEPGQAYRIEVDDLVEEGKAMMALVSMEEIGGDLVAQMERG